MTDACTDVKALIAHDPMDLAKVASTLEALTHSERVVAIRSLGKKAQARLWEAAAGRSTDLGDIVPNDTGATVQVIHSGKNSLPLFTKFEKRFCRVPGDESLLYGYNEGSTRWLVGPGYFVASVDSDRGEVGVNYYETPPDGGPFPADWPQVRPNERGISRFVYAKMIDYLRKVSDHVTIGRAVRKGKMTSNYFLLCRAQSPNS